MALKNCVRFSCSVLGGYITASASTGLTFPNAESAVSIMHETRNIPLQDIVPRNFNGANPNTIAGIINSAMAESGFNTEVDVTKQRRIEAWQLPYAVVRHQKNGSVVVTTDDMQHLQDKWAEITQKAEAMAQVRDLEKRPPTRQ